MFPTATDGSVEVDSNTGTAEDLRAELATEKPNGKGGTEADTPLPAVARTGDRTGDGGEPGEGDEGEPEAGRTSESRASEGEAGADGKKKRTPHKRIDTLTARNTALARELEESKAELARLKNGGREPVVEKPPAKKVAGVPIDAAAFPKYAEWVKNAPVEKSDIEDWIEARDEWKEGKAAEVRETREREETRVKQSAEFTKTITAYTDRMAEVLEAEPDFYDRVDPRLLDTHALSALPPGQKGGFGNYLVERIITSEHPKDLLLWLSDEATIQRLVTLQPDLVSREITKFELSIRPAAANGSAARERSGEEPPRRPAVPQSQAFEPVRPVRSTSQSFRSADEEPGDDASDDDWLRWQQKQSAKSRKH